MACLRRSTAAIQADITKWELKLSNAEETLDAINATPNELNRFNDNEGDQQVRKRKILDHMEYIEKIEDKLIKLRGELCGRTSTVTHVNRRNIGGGGIYL
mgnify:CR=1 FL=1